MEQSLKHTAYVYVFLHCSMSGSTASERKDTVKKKQQNK